MKIVLVLAAVMVSGSACAAEFAAVTPYRPSLSTALDVGLAHGLNAATPPWSLFSGAVLPLARLW